MDEQALNSLFNYIVTSFTLDVIAKANATQTNVDKYLRKQGLVLSDERIIQLIEGGQTSAVSDELRAFRNGVLRFLGDSVTTAGQSGITQYIEETSEDDDLYRWETRSGDSCPDCINRDGDVETYADWRDIFGLPVSGFSICGSRCKCQLVKVVT